MKTEYLLNVGTDIATAELESFCRRRYSLSSLVWSKPAKTKTALVQFTLQLAAGDDYEDARVGFRPAPDGKCVIDFDLSYAPSDHVLEDRGPLVATILFYDFVMYLTQKGYIEGSVRSLSEGRTRLIAALRELQTKLPSHVAGLRAEI